MSAALDSTERALLPTADDVRKAEEALAAVVTQGASETWTPRSLQEEARNGWSLTVMNIAFWNLVAAGRLEVDADFLVHPISEA
ncbi:MAG TPA: hypothetical protein VGR43_11850 [Dehalococcoidia bacterium]|jgi:hypothetical protein|nr:hypothetical protein [Dehalococcoidia bacterium]